MEPRDAARLDAWLTREPPEPDFECECPNGNVWSHWDCEENGDPCSCVGHIPNCDICGVANGCICDDLYESWKERRYG